MNSTTTNTRKKSKTSNNNNESSKSTGGSNENEAQFINHGLYKWEEQRKRWTGNSGRLQQQNNPTSSSTSDGEKPSSTKKQKREEQEERKLKFYSQSQIDMDDVIDYIISNRWRVEVTKAANTTISNFNNIDGKKKKRKSNNKKEKLGFDKPIPLTIMVDILVELWETEG